MSMAQDSEGSVLAILDDEMSQNQFSDSAHVAMI